MENKIKTWEEIERISKELRNKKILVTTCGTFDLLHPGHIFSMEEAKKQGDVLIICLNSDASVKTYKSPERPIENQEIRAKKISLLGCVDYVVIFEETTPLKLLNLIKPHKHVKSKSGFKGVETETIKLNGGEIILIEDVPGYSTTKIIEEKGINSS